MEDRRSGIMSGRLADPALGLIFKKKWKGFPKIPTGTKLSSPFSQHTFASGRNVRKRMNYVIVCEDDAFLRDGTLPTVRLESSRYGATLPS